MPEQLTVEEKNSLLWYARQALEKGVLGKSLEKIDIATLSETLRKPGASFVTLTIRAELRGCIGTLEAYQPLVEDVRQHAIDAAIHDYRFMRVQPHELKSIKIEISHLTNPETLDYSDTHDLLTRLRPGVDGVILRDGNHKATFLPQVWEKLPDPIMFLNRLCDKMGSPADTWRNKHLSVAIYQVEDFHE